MYTAKRVRVLHLIGSLNMGGAERVAIDLVRAIPRDEIEQTFVCLSGEAGSLAPEARKYGADVIVISLRPVWPFVRKLIRALRRRQPEVVMSHVSVASGVLLLLVRLVAPSALRIARLHSEGDGRPSTLRRKIYRALGRALLATQCDQVVAVSGGALQFGLGRWTPLAQLLRHNTAVIPNGVDISRFHPEIQRHAERPKLRVIHVGRAAPEKNRRAIPPIAEAVNGVLPAEFLLYGSTSVADLGDDDFHRGDVRPMGCVMDTAPVIRSADVLILPSLREGLPGVILEALASGTPVVASDLPGIRDLSKSVPGICLVDPTDTVAAWAQAVITQGRMGSEERDSLAMAIRSSPYALHKSAAAWAQLWKHGILPASSNGPDKF